MPTRSPDPSLRRTVVELASAAPRDIKAVLDQLEPNQRARVEALLRSYVGPAGPDRNSAGPAWDAAVQGHHLGLSPWLLDRLASNNPGAAANLLGPLDGGQNGGEMTSHVRETLADAVAEVHRSQRLASPSSTVRAPAWLSRVLGLGNTTS